MRNARDVLSMIRSNRSFSSMGHMLGEKLEKLASYRRNLELQQEPKMPEKAMPPIADYVRNLGQKLNMDPYQLQDMLNHNVDIEDELSVEALRRYLVTLKLADRVDFTRSKNLLAKADADHAERIATWRSAVEKVRANNERVKRDKEDAERHFREHWRLRVDSILKSAGEPHSGRAIHDLPNDIHWIMTVMAEKWPETVWVDERGLAWDREKINDLAQDPEDVRLLFRFAQMDERDAKVANHRKWAAKASVSQINEALLVATDTHETQLYQRILMVRQGFVPMVDRHGDTNWEVMVMRVDDQSSFNSAVQGWDLEWDEEKTIRDQFRTLNETHEDTLVDLLMSEYYGRY